MAAVDWSNTPGKPWATLTQGGERKIYVPGMGWQFPATINKELQKRGQAPIKDPGQPARKPPAGEPPKPSPAPSATPPAAPAAQPSSSTPAPSATPPAAPAAQPSSSTPAPSATPPAAPAEQPAPKPEPSSTPAPAAKSSPANLPAAEKIKQGMEVWKQQKAAGDLKGSAETGKSIWAAANPKLAAAAAERERTRGTAQTDNPLIDSDMRARMPKNTPSVQDPDLKQKLGNLAPNYSRLLDNPNALKGAAPSAPKPTPSSTTAFAGTTPALAKPSPAIQSAGQQYGGRALSSTGGASAFRPNTVSAASNLNAPTPVAQTARIASSTTQPTVAPMAGREQRIATNITRKATPSAPSRSVTAPTPTRAPIRQMQTQSYEYDAYDLVLEYLISTGHAETIEEASYIMLEMSPSEIQTVVNSYEYSGENVNEIAPLVAGLAGAAGVAALGKMAYDRLQQGKQKAQQTPTAKPVPSGPNLQGIGYNLEKRRQQLKNVENMQ